MNNQTEQPQEYLPDTAEMLQTISRCLVIGSCPSLASHCDRASKEILELRAKVLHLEKITSRVLEEQWKNEMYDKLEEQDYERNEQSSRFSKVLQQLTLAIALSSTEVKQTKLMSKNKVHSQIDWVVELAKEQKGLT
jgi:hypothetical protein